MHTTTQNMPQMLDLTFSACPNSIREQELRSKSNYPKIGPFERMKEQYLFQTGKLEWNRSNSPNPSKWVFNTRFQQYFLSLDERIPLSNVFLCHLKRPLDMKKGATLWRLKRLQGYKQDFRMMHGMSDVIDLRSIYVPILAMQR